MLLFRVHVPRTNRPGEEEITKITLPLPNLPSHLSHPLTFRFRTRLKCVYQLLNEFKRGSTNPIFVPEPPASNIWPILACGRFTVLVFPSDKSQHGTDTNTPSRASAVHNKHRVRVGQWKQPIFHNTQPLLYRGGVIKAGKRERTVDRRDGHIRKIHVIPIFFPPSAEDITSAERDTEKQTHMQCKQKMSTEMKFNSVVLRVKWGVDRQMDELWRWDGDHSYILTWEQNAQDRESSIPCISQYLKKWVWLSVDREMLHMRLNDE